MAPTQPRPDAALSEDELHALVDGHLSDAQCHLLETRLMADPAAAATRNAWREQRDAMKELHASLLNEPIPPALAAAARQAQAARLQVGHWWRWSGMAAGVALAFGLGWLSHGQFDPGVPGQSMASQGAAGAAGASEFAHQAMVAHAVYLPEVRHPVEVVAAQQEHLVQWLSKRLNRPLKIPDLSAQGYELVGGRLLPGNEGARAQFMFQNAAGERITLYLGAVKNGAVNQSTAATVPDRRESAFSFSSDGPVPGFYWVDQGFGYALAGNLSRERLMAIAQAVYRQL